MERLNQLARLILDYRLGVGMEAIPPEHVQGIVDELARAIESRFGKPVLPQPTESVAVTFDVPKTAALFFDRIWSCPALQNEPPNELSVYGASDAEVWPQAVLLALRPPHWDWERIQQFFSDDTPIGDMWAQTGLAASIIGDALFREHGIRAVPMFESAAACEREYRIGDTEAIVAAVEDLRIVDEAELQWNQVMEFRSDTEARRKLRRMRHWLDSEFVGKPVSYVSDALAIRLEDYEWALKKHGIETVIGSLTGLLDPCFLSAASVATAGLALAGGEFWAAIGATGILAGKAALSVTTKLIDLKDRKRGKGSEIAFISEIKRMTAR